MSDGMQSGMARRLRNQGVPLGEVLSFISGLYFRGKLAYAEKFAEVAGDVRAAYVITASAGLIPCELERLREISAGEVDRANEKDRGPLDRDSAPLSELVGRLPGRAAWHHSKSQICAAAPRKFWRTVVAVEKLFSGNF